MKGNENERSKSFITEGLLSYPLAVELCDRFRVEMSQYLSRILLKCRSKIPMQITADKSDSQRYYFGHYLEDSKSKQYRYVGLYYDLFTGVPRIIFLTTKNQKNLQISANWTPKNRTFNFDSAQKDFDAHCISYSIPKDNSQFEKKVEELLLEGIGLMKAMK